MATTVTPQEPRPSPGDTADGGRDGGRGRDWGNDGRGGGKRRPSLATCRLGILLGLASISMLFLGLTSAYVFRQGVSTDWQATKVPPLLIVTAAVLVVSSCTMEMARRSCIVSSARGGTPAALQKWLAATLVLGLIFVGGQVLVWSRLADSGVYLGTNPHSSFFYLLTGLHGIHLLGGVVALAAATARTRGAEFAKAPAGERALAESAARRWIEVTAIYWHFMDGLYIYLVLLLFVWAR